MLEGNISRFNEIREELEEGGYPKVTWGSSISNLIYIDISANSSQKTAFTSMDDIKAALESEEPVDQSIGDLIILLALYLYQPRSNGTIEVITQKIVNGVNFN